MRKVVVFTNTDQTISDAKRGSLERIKGWLRNMGYEVHESQMNDGSGGGDNFAGMWTAQGYEFAVFFAPFAFNGASGTDMRDLRDGEILPLFVTCLADLGSFWQAEFGLTQISSNQRIEADYAGLGQLWFWGSRARDNETAGKEITPLITDSAAPDDIFGWKQTSGTYTVYGDTALSNGAPGLLPFLMQHAINDGQIQPPPKRLICSFDTDDFPSDDNPKIWTAEEAEAFASDLKAARMVTTIGMPASKTIGGTNEFVTQWEPAGVLSVVRENQIRNGGPFYPIEHMGDTFWSVAEIDGNPSGGQSKTDIDTFYRDHIDNMHDHGIWQGWDDDGLDSYGYHYFNVNQIDAGGLELATPMVTPLADPAGTTAMAGYGWKVARFDSNVRAGQVGQLGFHHTSRNDYLGVRIIPASNTIASSTYDLDPTNSANYETYYLQCVRNYLQSAAELRPIYMHGQNGDDYLNNAVDPPLRVCVQAIGRINRFCTDVLRCGHPSEYANL
jgi:hypothetical protein